MGLKQKHMLGFRLLPLCFTTVEDTISRQLLKYYYIRSNRLPQNRHMAHYVRLSGGGRGSNLESLDISLPRSHRVVGRAGRHTRNGSSTREGGGGVSPGSVCCRQHREKTRFCNTMIQYGGQSATLPQHCSCGTTWQQENELCCVVSHIEPYRLQTLIL